MHRITNGTFILLCNPEERKRMATLCLKSKFKVFFNKNNNSSKTSLDFAYPFAK